MKLYVCWGTFRPRARAATRAATPTRPCARPAATPRSRRSTASGCSATRLNPTRAKVRELTGQNIVPVLVTDEDEVIRESRKIIAWAKANPPTRPAVGRSPG